MRRPRQVAALLAALLMLPALAACKPREGGGDTSSAGGSTESTVAAPADIPVVSGKASEFVIVRPDSADSTEIDVAKELREQLEEVLSTLTPREEHVIKLRFGLYDGRTRTLEEVGKEFDITRERIRQIEAKALRKLRHPSRSRKLKDFLE